MFNFCFLVIILLSLIDLQYCSDTSQIQRLVTKWAPLIWFSPEENYFPLPVSTFLENVHVEDEYGNILYDYNKYNIDNKSNGSLFFVTNNKLDEIQKLNSSFLNGYKPTASPATPLPIYAVVKFCSSPPIQRKTGELYYGKSKPHLNFQVTYWTFYPYNKGKKICLLGKVPLFALFGTCLGAEKVLGSHVGDWEHMTLLFRGKPYPSELYLSVHDNGGYYKYDPVRRNFKFQSLKFIKKVQKPIFPPIVRVQSGHPVVFAAEGSHGLWPSPGDHEYVLFPRLVDKCAYGIPWKTWNHIEVYFQGVNPTSAWMKFKGRWGNPRSNCILLKKFGLCEYNDGPEGISEKTDDFQC